MTSENASMTFGRLVYGLGVLALGIVCLVSGDFISGQPASKNFPDRTVLAYAAGAFLFATGAAIEWRRTAAWAAAALAAYLALVVVVLMNGRVVLAHYAEFLAYFGVAEQLSLVTGALLIFAASASLDGRLAARLARTGQIAFGLCLLFFGSAHFVFMNLTAPLVPKWLPPSQVFWGYATGVGFFAAGAALISGVQARLAAILLTVMLASFAVLVHAPTLLAEPASRGNWTEAAINFAITGVAWVMADSLRQPGVSSGL
jgi:uncharacterized membrane protein YphA (DoxX/SURF4 family)